MSGIFGIYNLNGAPVTHPELQRMAAPLQRRGPDGTGIWHEGPVGLGHTMLWTTPESLHERPPVVNRRGDLVITADVRLDNRDELIDVLRLRQRPAWEIGDQELILSAYEKWGENSPTHLLGDFAFAIWDRKERQIFCARDILGIKPFYYSYGRRHFVFGSDVETLLQHPWPSHELNEGMIGEYLSDSIRDREDTFYKDVLRLPSAFSMTISQSNIQKTQFWNADSIVSLNYNSETEYVDHFLEVFKQAVTARLRTPKKVGALLSGGIDSSLVVCMLARLQQEGVSDIKDMETFSLSFPGLSTDESSTIVNFSEIMGVHGNILAYKAYDLDDCKSHLNQSRGFPDTATGLAYYPIYDLAKQHGIGVLFSGWGADDWLGPSLHFYADLVSQGKLTSLAHQFLSDYRRHNLGTAINRLTSHGLRPMVPERLRTTKRYFDRKLRRRRSSVPPWIQEGFAQQTNLQNRLTPTNLLHPTRSRGNFQKQARIRWLNSGMMAVNSELQERSLALHGLEGRYPYNDKRMIEFGIAVPSQFSQLYGQRKGVLFAAINKLCPQLVHHTFSDPDGSPIYLSALANIGGSNIFSSLTVAKRGWIDEGEIKAKSLEAFQQYSRNDDRYAYSVRALWLVLGIEIWIESELRS